MQRLQNHQQPSKPRISVALCTCNGETYLREQLQSIAVQQRQPDELVICDDCSRDRTVRIVEEFVAHLSFPVVLKVNTENLGTTKNFEQVIGLCQGDILVLSDQDDVWYPHRLAVIESHFSRRPEVALVFSDAVMVDQDLKPLGYSLWQSIGFVASEQSRLSAGKATEVLLKHNVVTGATMAFRSSYRNFLFPIPECWLHDGWAALLISTVADILPVQEPLILYRQHPSNQVGAIRRSPLEKWLDLSSSDPSPYSAYCIQLEAFRKRLEERLVPRTKRAVSQVQAKLTHLRMRANMPMNRFLRLPFILRETLTGRYFRFSNGYQSMIKDLFVMGR